MSAPITLVGRLVADPELRFGQNGTAVCKFRVVTSQRRKVGDEWQDVDTTFWHVSCFKQLAENVAESLLKGHAVIVVGRQKSREYETREGEKRTAWEVTADSVGVDLNRATAKPQKVQRGDGGFSGQQSDPWASSTPADSGDIPF